MSDSKQSHLRIGIEKPTNSEVHVFYTNRKMSDSSIERFHFPIGREYSNDLKEIGEVGRTIVETLDIIGGITTVIIQPYELTIEKGRMFDWEELIPQIVVVLKDVLQDPEAEVQTLPIPMASIQELLMQIHRAFGADAEPRRDPEEEDKTE